jgi:hypothetical protein
MSITFKHFSALVSEGRTPYSSESYWKGDAKSAGYTVKKVSGNLSDGDQTWAAYDDADKKVGEFTEKEDNRGGWLIEDLIFETFGLFRNNQKIEKMRAKKKPGEREEDDEDSEKDKNTNPQDKNKQDEEPEEDPQDKFKKRSNSTIGTKSTRPLGRREQK